MRDFEAGFSFENYPSGLKAPNIPEADKVRWRLWFELSWFEGLLLQTQR